MKPYYFDFKCSKCGKLIVAVVVPEETVEVFCGHCGNAFDVEGEESDAE